MDGDLYLTILTHIYNKKNQPSLYWKDVFMVDGWFEIIFRPPVFYPILMVTNVIRTNEDNNIKYITSDTLVIGHHRPTYL